MTAKVITIYDDFKYSIRIEDDGTAITVKFKSYEPFTNRMLISALEGLIEAILKDCEAVDEST